MIDIAAELKGEVIAQEKVKESEKVSILNNAEVLAVLGNRMVSAIKIKVKDREKELAVQGVFVEIGLIPNSEFTQGVARNKAGEIEVNSRNETNVAGIFAAGDVTDVAEKQIIVAAGEGAKAALGAFRYLSRNR